MVESKYSCIEQPCQSYGDFSHIYTGWYLRSETSLSSIDIEMLLSHFLSHSSTTVLQIWQFDTAWLKMQNTTFVTHSPYGFGNRSIKPRTVHSVSLLGYFRSPTEVNGQNWSAYITNSMLSWSCISQNIDAWFHDNGLALIVVWRQQSSPSGKRLYTLLFCKFLHFARQGGTSCLKLSLSFSTALIVYETLTHQSGLNFLMCIFPV